MSQTSHDRNNSRRRSLGTIIQSIFCAQSGAGIRLNFWKSFGESGYPGALSPVLENFRRALSPDPTDCPWVSKDDSLPICLKRWRVSIPSFFAIRSIVPCAWSDMLLMLVAFYCSNSPTKYVKSKYITNSI